MGQWEEGMTINVREGGSEIHGAGNWNMLMDRMQNVVVCRGDRQGPSRVTCLLAHSIRNGMTVVTINWLRTDQFRYISFSGFLKSVEISVCESVKENMVLGNSSFVLYSAV
jgi:hypothetical protein